MYVQRAGCYLKGLNPPSQALQTYQHNVIKPTYSFASKGS